MLEAPELCEVCNSMVADEQLSSGPQGLQKKLISTASVHRDDSTLCAPCQA